MTEEGRASSGPSSRTTCTVRQLQDPLDAGLHVAGRIQEGGGVPPGIVQIGFASPAPDRLASQLRRVSASGGYAVKSASGLALDYCGRGADEGNEVWLYEPNGTPARDWLTITI